MRTRWLVAALVASLALNAGAVGALLWQGLRRWRGERRFYHELRQDTRRRISTVLDEHRVEMESLRDEYFEARRALALLGDRDQPDPAEVDSLLDRLSGVHREMNRLAFSAGQEIFRMLPEQRRGIMRERWEKMHRGPGRCGRRHCGPGGPPPRPGRRPPPPGSGFEDEIDR